MNEREKESLHEFTNETVYAALLLDACNSANRINKRKTRITTERKECE
jgi:hypothetical protein